jgi:4-diphosphocytidyl-2-C-methyl-D-erythritol kinase
MRSSLNTIPSRAKINLGLRLVGKRDDGYHDIETVFHEIDFCDYLTFERSHRLELTCSDPALPVTSENLVYQAALALATRCNVAPAVRIHLEKRIPLGSGMGGGSSNAACTLRMLNTFWKLGLGAEDLRSEASKLGADVSFFLTGGTCIGTGRGDVLEPIACPLRLSFVLAFPGYPVSTARAYQRADLKLTNLDDRTSILVEGLRSGDLRRVSTSIFNDLELGIDKDCPEISKIKKLMRSAGCIGACMSGSGSAVFGIARTRQHAESVAGVLAADGFWVQTSGSWKGGGQA